MELTTCAIPSEVFWDPLTEVTRKSRTFLHHRVLLEVQLAQYQVLAYDRRPLLDPQVLALLSLPGLESSGRAPVSHPLEFFVS